MKPNTKRQAELTREQQIESAHIQNELGVKGSIGDYAAMLTKPETAMQAALANALKDNPHATFARI